MPQTHRSVAFSGKKKKEQLKERKERKLRVQTSEVPDHQMADHHRKPELTKTLAVAWKHDESTYTPRVGVNYLEDVQAINQQPVTGRNCNRYNQKFRRETQEQLKKRIALHHAEIDLVSEIELETSSESFFPSGLNYPSRPQWKSMSKHELDRSENRYFRQFCEDLDQKFAGTDLSLYELNLETWRQLWRVTEMSDILLIIVDARFSVAQFPPYLYQHLVEKENKSIILILNKCDLVPPAVIIAWEQYFHNKFPELLVVPFSSVERYTYGKGLLKMATESSLRLVDACQELVDDSVNLELWRKKIEERELESESEYQAIKEVTNVAQGTRPELHQRFKHGILTIGTIGHPNVGKSSLINALMGKKVVSVSKTPGHTKHFQTIFLAKNVKLCDCPGLVFPSTASIPLQILLGSYPISQVRDPVGIVHYIASRLDIPTLLKLYNVTLTQDMMESSKWTAYYICEAWANKRGYHTRARGKPDVSRAANELLRLCHNGRKSLLLFFRPPEYCKNKEKFESNTRIQDIKRIQGIHAKDLEPLSLDAESNKVEEDVEDEQVCETERTDSEDATESESEESEVEAEVGLRVDVQNKFDLLTEDD